MKVSRPQLIGLVVGALAIAFLLGFVPQFAQNRALDREVSVLQHELDVSRLQNILGAALAEAQRSNYERARQLMTTFFSGAEHLETRVGGEQREALREILEQRDEIITLLSRASAEATPRLNQIYTRYHQAMTPPAPASRPGGGDTN